MVDEQRDVLKPLAQGRDRTTGESEVEILAELTLVYEVEKRTVGGGDDAHVDVIGHAATALA